MSSNSVMVGYADDISDTISNESVKTKNRNDEQKFVEMINRNKFLESRCNT